MKKIDFHVHILDDIPLEDTIRHFQSLCQRKGYEGVGVMSLVHDDVDLYIPDANRTALAVKNALGNSFAFAGLDHHRDFVEQTKEYMAAGFDGIKLLEGKPSCYRLTGMGYDHPRFDPFFAYCEKQGIPLMIHVNDPKTFWDAEKVSESARRNGWFYGEGDIPSHEDFKKTLENVLLRFPRLRVAMAHLGFYADELPRAAALLDRFENLFFDVTPALPIYIQLCDTPAESKAFFEKYHTRLIFGTDCYNDLTEGGKRRRYNDKKTDILTAFYEGQEDVEMHDRIVRPISLNEEMLENIYYNNALRFVQKI